MRKPFGVIEGFFGPTWSWAERRLLAELLGQWEASFYIYAPKRDGHLRKSWEKFHPKEEWENIVSLADCFHRQGTSFGIGLSPFGLEEMRTSHWGQKLKEKIKSFDELKLDFLGVFFDDMHAHPQLLENQLRALSIIEDSFMGRILFCPTYYSDDPILEKVFGPSPPNYLNQLGRKLDPSVDIMWTGPKVISAEISADHLREVSNRLERPPFIWDNLFANDGPRQCKFLKLIPTLGRDRQAFSESAGWCFNPMNQASLSRLVIEGSYNLFRENSISGDGQEIFKDVLVRRAGEKFFKWWEKNKEKFLHLGLDQIDKYSVRNSLNSLAEDSSYIHEIINFINGHYVVGPECLTD